MKNSIIILCVIFAASISFQSCQSIKNSNKSQQGAAAGGTGGALAGALIGGKKNRALGAIIGAVVGGSAGAIIGNQMDKQAREIERTMPGATVVRTGEGIQIILDEKSDVRFDFDSSELTDSSKNNLDDLIGIFKKYPDTNILVIGYTDSKGSDDYNLKLSERRATSVVDYITSNGVDLNRLTSQGLGEAEPIASNDTDEGRAQNRRVEFAITANDTMIENAQKEANK